jgi:hypothetical protein
MKIFTVDGKIIDLSKPYEVFLGMWKKDGYWMVSGVMYHDPREVEPNLFNFKPDQILIVKVEVPEELR